MSEAPQENRSPADLGRAVAKAGAYLTFALTLSRLLGMVRDTVMVAQFGIGLETDAYRIAVQIPDMIFMLIAGGGLSSAFIPVFSELWHTDRRDEAWKVFSSVATIVAILTTLVIGAAWAFTPEIVDFFRGAHPASVNPSAILMSRIMLPAQFAFVVGSLLLGTLYARNQYLVPGLTPNVYNVGIIVGALALPRIIGFGIVSMAWGAVVGAAIGNLLLPALAMARLGSRFVPRIDFRLEGVRKFFVLLAPIVFGFSLPSMVNIVTQKFASSYGQEGVNTVLNLSANIMQAPLGIFGQSLALAAFPVLAEYFATQRMELYREQVNKTIRQVLYLGVPSGIVCVALAPEIVRGLYGYGRAGSSAQELEWTTNALRIYGVGIFAWCVQPVLMRAFFSMHKTLKPILISTGMTVLFIALCAAATRVSSDFMWIPWATDIAVVLSIVSLFFALEGDVGRLDRAGTAVTFLKATLAAAVSGLVVFALARLFTGLPKLVQVAALVVACLVFAWTYFFVTRALKMPESAYLDRAFARLARRRASSSEGG